MTAEQVEDVVVTTLESTPEHRDALVEVEDGRAVRSVGFDGRAGIGRPLELKPHRAEGFKLSNDPLFVDKVYDVVGLYFVPQRCRCLLRRRKEPGPSARPLPARVSHDAGHAREAHARLPPPRHDELVRGVQHHRWVGHLEPAPPTPQHRVQEVPRKDRHRCPRRPRCPPRL